MFILVFYIYGRFIFDLSVVSEAFVPVVLSKFFFIYHSCNDIFDLNLLRFNGITSFNERNISCTTVLQCSICSRIVKLFIQLTPGTLCQSKILTPFWLILFVFLNGIVIVVYKVVEMVTGNASGAEATGAVEVGLVHCLLFDQIYVVVKFWIAEHLRVLYVFVVVLSLII